MDGLAVGFALGLFITIVCVMAVVINGKHRERAQASAMGTYHATRRRAPTYTGRRGGDFCPDPDCALASRSHRRNDCGNVYVTAGEWNPTPDPVTQGLADRDARLYPDTSNFTAHLKRDFAARDAIRSHTDIPQCRDRTHSGWPGYRRSCAECRDADARDVMLATADSEPG